MPSLKWFVMVTITGLISVWGFLYFRNNTNASYQFTSVTQGPITETVSMTGNTTPMQNVSLAFQSQGTITQTYFNLGDQVHKGDTIAKLNTANLVAALAQAQADEKAQDAILQGLLVGAQPDDISVSQTALETAQSNLEQTKKIQAVLVDNAHRALLNSRIVAQPLVSSTIPAPVISGTYNKTEVGTMTISIYGTPNGGYFSTYGLGQNSTGNLVTVQMGVSNTQPPVPIGDTGLYLRLPGSNEATAALTTSSGVVITSGGVGVVQNTSAGSSSTNNYDGTVWTVTVPNMTSQDYTQNYNLYQQALQTQTQAIAAAQAQVDQAQANLKLKRSGSTPQSVSAQQARVDQARAAIANAEANLENAKIVAPIDGVLTQQDARVGEQALPGVKLVSIIGNGGFEIDAGVSEKDVGKLQAGNTVSITLDAFPGETFVGTIFYVAPTETNTQGVITYLVKISFNTPDLRIKSGLTANLTIDTKHKDNVLTLPVGAILQNDQGTFVEVPVGKKTQRVPVVLGIQDQNSNVEIVSGVTANEQVINIGLKTK